MLEVAEQVEPARRRRLVREPARELEEGGFPLRLATLPVPGPRRDVHRLRRDPRRCRGVLGQRQERALGVTVAARVEPCAPELEPRLRALRRRQLGVSGGRKEDQ